MTAPDFPPRFDTDLLRPYWEGISRGELVLPACSECAGWQWYPFEFVKCHPEAHHVWKTVPATGTVFTFTTVHRSLLPNAAREDPPYVTALIEPDGLTGIRVPALLVNVNPGAFVIGMAVKLAPVQRSAYRAPAFEPVTNT